MAKSALIPISDADHRWRATRPADYLDRFVRAEQGFDDTNLNEIDLIYAFSKLSALCQKIWAQLLLLSFIICILLAAFPTINGFRSYGVYSFKYFRLETMDASYDAARHMQSTSDITLALFRKGCQIFSTTHLSTPWNGTVSLPLPLETDGFSLSSHGNRTLALADFVLLASTDGVAYTPFGAPHIRLVPEGPRLSSGPAALHPGPGPGLAFDYRPPWPMMLSTVTDTVFAVAVCATMAALGAASRPHLAKRALALQAAAAAAAHATAVAGYASLAAPADAALPAANALAFSLASWALAGPERSLLSSMAAAGLISLLAHVADDCLLHTDCPRLYIYIYTYMHLYFMCSKSPSPSQRDGPDRSCPYMY
jgi:hypothetical protein